MAALRWCSGVLRSVYRGGISVPELRSSCQYNKLKLSQEVCYQSAIHNVTVQQARLSSSFFNKLKLAALGLFHQVPSGGSPARPGRILTGWCAPNDKSYFPVLDAGKCDISLRACSPVAVYEYTATREYLMKLAYSVSANELWKGVLAETGVGSRKGRGKRTKKRIKKNLNLGQHIGEGKSGFLWPGLNMPIKSGEKAPAIAKRDKQQLEEMQAKIFEERDNFDKKRKTRVKRERGWTGKSWGGISIGHPDPGPNGETYEDFDCRVIELKSVFSMSAKEGRKKSVSALVAVGNGQGAAGFAVGKASDRMIALRKAKNRAVHYLHYIERYDNHTIYHDITTTFKRTTIKIKKQNAGYGLRCHRAIITICKLIGIKDMYAKLSGSHNLLNLIRALFLGLAQQESHEDLANKKGLHVIEFREECGPFPRIVASPRRAISTIPEPEGEIPDTKLDWEDVKLTQGIKRSPWASVKRTIW